MRDLHEQRTDQGQTDFVVWNEATGLNLVLKSGWSNLHALDVIPRFAKIRAHP